MKTPRFWSAKTRLSTALLPLSCLYRALTRTRNLWINPVTLPIPVICIGNLTAGGAGKTPVALHIGGMLREKNIQACFLTRGYKGRKPGPLLVDPAVDDARAVGDEPLLLSRILPTIMAKNRPDGALFAIGQGAELLIMDDGFQNPSIVKTLSLVVVDGQTGFGNGRTLPAGPLREPLAQALPRADAFIILNRSPATPKLPTGKPVFFATTQPLAPETLRGQPLIAFCGLGYPQKFFTMLTAHGATLAESAAFPDHHTYTASDLKTLTRLAARHKARLATTAKDAARLPPDALPNLLVVDIQLVFDDQAAFTRLITQTLPHHEEP